ncbi:hypothetical protein UlMin_030902 [Ulmus minor]
MENGTGVFAETHVRDDENEQVGVSEERVEEKDVLGTKESNDSEVEEVFEEAMDAQEHLHEQGMNADSGDTDEDGEEGKVVAFSDTGLKGVDVIPNAGDEVENFEEAIGVPADVGTPEDVDEEPVVNAEEREREGEVEVEEPVVIVEERERDFTGGNNVDGAAVSWGIDERGTEMEAVTNEVNGVSDDVFAGGRNDEEKVISEIDAGEIEATHAGDVVEENVPAVIQNEEFEKDNFDGVTVKLAPTTASGKLDSEAAPLDSRQETESSKEISSQVSNDQKLDENTLDDKDQNGRVEKMINDSDGPSPEFHDYNGIKLDEEHNDTVHPEPASNGLKDSSVVIDSTNGDDNGVELQKSRISAEKDHRNGELNETSAGLPSEHSGETRELNNTVANVETAAEDRTLTLDDASFIEPSTTEKEEIVQVSTVELVAENDSSKPQQVIGSAHEVHNDAVAKEPEKKEEMEEEKQSIQVTRAYDKEEIKEVIANAHEVRNDTVAKEPEKKEEIKEEKPSIQANRARDQPAQEHASSPAKSINPTPPPARPAGLGRAAPLLEPAPRVVQHPRVNGSASQTQNQQIEELINGDSEDYDETREKLQMIRVKFLRLAHRLGQTPHNVVVAQVLYRLGLAEQLRGRNGGRVGAFSFDRASALAEQLEAFGQDPLDFSCTIMVLGKTGVGKSATINSIFDEVKFSTDAFQMGTKKVQDVVGTVQGIKVRVIDTPGLLPSWADQRQNEKILHSVKRFIKKTPPDIVLYLDRLDMQCRDFSDMPLLRTITDIFGPSIWCNAIVVLTHAASAPPDGPNGTASSYDMFVTQRSHVVQQAIRQAAADMRLMNPVSLVENHSACRTNRAGQRVLPNGQVWKPHLLLLSFASKILAEANALLKLQDSPPGRPYATRSRAPPLPFLLSSLLQSRPQLKLPEEQYGDDDDLGDDLDDSSDSDSESEYDELPPFKRLSKAQVSKLSKAQKKAYFDELEYREKLFMKKQLKEEKQRRKMMKKMAAAAKDLPSDYGENVEEESTGAASVPVPMPDLALPASFDSDNPTHRYRCLDSSNQWLVRPVLDSQGWDHDVGYEGINVERLFAVQDKVPLSFSGQVTKDKKDANVQMEVASSIKHGEGKSTSLGFDMQSVGKDLAYTLRSETMLCNFRKNKANAGLSVTLLGDALSAGVKVEDKLIANKRFRLVVTGGAMTGRGDVAYGGSLEAQLRDKDYPLGRSLSTLGLSVMDWHGDLAIGCNVQSQLPVGRHTNLIARANLNNRGAGQVSIRLNSSEQLQIALVGLLPLLRKILSYPQQMQY